MNTIIKRIKHVCIALIGLGLLAININARADTITRYVMTDTLGNPVAKTDSTGEVIWRQSYTPYGQQYQQADPDGPGFTGHRNDAATGLVYMQARYYDPKIGRFLSVDPVTFSPDSPGHFNLYWYANGNPYRYTDPDGRSPFIADLADPYKYTTEAAINPNTVLFSGDETVGELAGRVNGETLRMSDSKLENEPLGKAREKIAHVRLNGIKKWGDKVQNHASLASPIMHGPGYQASLEAVETAVAEDQKDIDPTKGARHYNMRTPSQAKAGHKFLGKFPVNTDSGPYKSPTKYTHIVTYGPPS